MRYLRCKCGKREAWSSMGVPRCDGCECGTTLDEHPADHTAPEPHRWGDPEWKLDPKSGERWQVRYCLACPAVIDEIMHMAKARQ